VKLLGGLLVAAALLAQSDSEMSRIAQSPYEIERWVNQTPAFDWKPLWKALSIQDSAFLPQCEAAHPNEIRQCTAEAITISEPAIVVLVLRSGQIVGFEEYLRFLPVTTNSRTVGWKFAGHFAPFVKYFSPTHRLQWVGNNPYLLVTGQGNAGMCMSSEVEHWVDLTGKEMEPVFTYTVKGSRCESSIPDREITGAVISIKMQPERRNEVVYTVRFSTPTERPAQLGNHTETVRYRWKPGQGYQVDDGHSTLPGTLVGKIFEDLLDPPSCEDYLRYDVDALKELAAEPNGPPKRWLASFLQGCKPTPEKRVLEELLHAPAKKE
jgi:hypothetical protein